MISTYAQMLAKQVAEDSQKSLILDKIAKQTFRVTARPSSPPVLRLETLVFDRDRRQVVARFADAGSAASKTVVAGIVLLDSETLVPLTISYSTHTDVSLDPATGMPKRVTLDIPADVRVEGRSIVAVAMLDLEPCGELVIDAVKLPPWTFAQEVKWLVGMRK